MLVAGLGAIAMMWVASLLLPVWEAREKTPGYAILLAGCLGLQPQWLGNPLIIAVCLLALWGVGSALVMVPLAIALVAVFIGTAATRQVLVDEGGGKAVIGQKFAGYYLWMAAVLSSALLALYLGMESLGVSV